MMIADELQLRPLEYSIHHYLIGINKVFGEDCSTFIKTFCEGYDPFGETSSWQAFFPARSADTGYGVVLIDDQSRLAFHNPGNGFRSDFLQWNMWKNTTMLGHIILFDSTCPMGFHEIRSLNETYRDYAPFPYIFALNCLDYVDAWSVDGLRYALDVADDVPIVPYVGTDFYSVRDVVLTLLQHVLEEIEYA